MHDIKQYQTFKTIKQLNKGWSSDKKYFIETVENEKRLLRVTDISEYDKKNNEFKMMQRLAAFDLPMSQPIDFGICNNGQSVYSLLTWRDGEDAEVVLPKLTETEQYVLGLKSGHILRQIHSIPAPQDQEPWEPRFNRKADNKINSYKDCGIQIDGGDPFITYIEANRHLLQDRPQSFQHGDYHVGNMVISDDGELSIIDFNRYDYGDPWEEFNRIVWSAEVSPHFATGQLNGYFNGKPPLYFFKLLAFYISSNALGSIAWAIPFGEKQVDVLIDQADRVLTWFDSMQNPIPTWYLPNFYIQYVNNKPYKLKSPFDMSFIEQYGTIFKIFDDQDSGNICFGVEDNGKQYFIKFAGAPTDQYSGNRVDAIARLKAAIPAYQNLAHPNLIKFIKSEEIGGGFAAIFEWADGVCLGRMYPLSRERFMRTSDTTRLNIFNDILDFHMYVAKQGYVAIDFYDGSIMYDERTGQTKICDIDFYSKTPYINTMGRMWGSSRFMAPEEYTLGAPIDEITNVYVMGATAFALFGSETKRSIETWRLNNSLYDVALKAVNDNRHDRHQSLAELKSAWEKALVK